MNTTLMICLATVALAFSVPAQVTSNRPPAAPPGTPNTVVPERNRPQSGKIVSIDKAAPSLTIGPREGAAPAAASVVTSNVVLQVATNTVFMKNGQRVTLNDMAVGDQVQFVLRKTPDGKESAGFVLVGGAAIRPALRTNVPPSTPVPTAPQPRR